MAHIRENQYDFDKLTIFELINNLSYWVESSKLKHNSKWKYYWWKLNFDLN